MTFKDPMLRQWQEETAEDFDILPIDDLPAPPSICYFVTGDAIGSGEKGKELMIDFFTSMVNQRCYPKYVILMDRAAGFLCRGHVLNPIFQELEKNGSTVFASEESLRFYGWEKEIAPLFAASTGKIIELLNSVDKVITL